VPESLFGAAQQLKGAHARIGAAGGKAQDLRLGLFCFLMGKIFLEC
jgi:hypothetical protein